MVTDGFAAVRGLHLCFYWCVILLRMIAFRRSHWTLDQLIAPLNVKGAKCGTISAD